MGDESLWSAPSDRPPPPPVPASGFPGPPMPGPSGWPPLPAPVPAARRTMRTGAIVACVLVGLVGLGSCGALIAGAVRLVRGPIRATDKYFSALERRDYTAAFALECPVLQSAETADDLRQAYDQSPIVSWHSHGFSEDSNIGGTTVATVDGTLTTVGGSRDVTIFLTDLGGTWLVCTPPFGTGPGVTTGPGVGTS